MKTVYPLAFVVALSLLLSACPSTDKKDGNKPPQNAATHTDNKPANPSPIKARQDLMHRWGKATRQLQAMTKNPAEFDRATLTQNLDELDGSQAQMWAYFDGDALAIDNKVNRLIKDNPSDYQAHIERFTAAFNALKNTAYRTPHLDTLTPLIEKVNQECKACHKHYKKRG
ncbi:MAG: cytochrome c [Moraxella sp.]|nr:cytochrome c [Moraxella sp.]